MRIDRFLSNLKYGTRKEIQKAIKYKQVFVNNELVKSTAFKIDPEVDSVMFNEEKVFYKETILLMMNKPQEYVSANKDGKSKTVFELINLPYSRFDLKIAGRLDKDTEGLLLLTNNGKLLHSIISPNKDVYKKYFVRVDRPMKKLSKLTKEYEILDGRDYPFVPATPIVERINDSEFYLSIKEGKFHQIKRMVEHFDRKVVYLKRVEIGGIKLDESLKIGQYKEITNYEI